MKYIPFVLVASLFFCLACQQTNQNLPIKGQIDKKFRFVNQDSARVTEKTVAGKIYVTDFFFTTCPTICPVMKSQLIRVNDQFKDRDDFLILSHSIDSKDSVAVLQDYAQRLGVKSTNWHFVTGDRKMTFDMAKTYMITAGMDENAPGGYIHSGAFVLIDKKGRVRGFYDGTKAEETDVLIRDISYLINE